MRASTSPRFAAAACVACAFLLLSAGPALGAAQLSIGPSSWDAGIATAGTDGASQQFKLTNLGDQTAAPGAASIGGADADSFDIDQDGCAGAGLAPSDSCTVTVRFHPPYHAGAQSRSATLDFGSAPVAVTPAALAGFAQDPPHLSAQPPSLDFGVRGVNQGSNSQLVTAQNDGGSAVQISSVSIDGPGSGAYWVQSSDCPGQTLQPGNSCQVQVSFGPNDPVAYPATLHVGGPGAQVDVALSGTGGAAQLVPEPGALDFGAVDVGDGATLGLSLHNVGNSPFQAIVVIPSGGDVGAFRVVSDGCSMQRLDPDGACTLALRFSPLRVGDAHGTLMVIQGDGPPLLLQLSGTGRQARATITPGGVDFGVLTPGTAATRSLQVSNTGNAPLRVGDVGVGGADAGQFAVTGETCTAAPIEPGAGCKVGVRFTPDAKGARSASLRIATNDAAGIVSAPLRGTGGTPAKPARPRAARLAVQARRGLPLPYTGGRADLGPVSCATGPACQVTITAAFLAGRSSASARTLRTMLVRRATRLTVRLPSGLRGRPRTAVVRMRVAADGYRTATTTLRFAVVAGRRVGPLVVADPPRRQSGSRILLGTIWCSASRACDVRVKLASRSPWLGTLTTLSSRLSPDAVWNLAVGRGPAAGPLVVVFASGRGRARLPIVLPGFARRFGR